MKKAIAVLLVCGAVFPMMSAGDSPPGFNTLAVAVNFIESCLTGNDHARLFSACVNLTNTDENYNVWLFNRLVALNAEIPFHERYRTRFFPESGNNYKLGGHFMELGCIHIDFVKIDSLWYLSDIWMCK